MKKLAAALLIVAATFCVYFPSLQNGFVWDDGALVLRDPLIRSWRLAPESFRHFLFLDAGASNFYRPLQRLSYTIDYAFFGFDPAGYHFTNIILHCAAAAMLFLLLQRLIATFDGSGRGFGLAAGVATIWAVHPVHTSAVCYVAGRADPLAAFFGFAGLYFGLAAPGKKRWLEWVAALCFFCAMLSKESAVASLAIYCAALYLSRDFSRARRWMFVTVAIVAAYCALRFTAGKVEPPVISVKISAPARPLLVARAFAEYAGLIAAPVNLHMERNLVAIDHGDLEKTVHAAWRREWQTLLGCALLAGFAGWARHARIMNPLTFFSLAAFAITYAPISNIVGLNATAAEHWLYIPSAFLLFAAATAISRRWIFAASGIALAWTVFLGARTLVRNYDWRDERTFLECTIRAGGDSARMFIQLGTLESQTGNFAAARKDFDEALERAPNQPFALLGLANMHIRAGDYTGAHVQLDKTVLLPPFKPQSLLALAALQQRETGRDSFDLIREAAAIAPQDWQIQKRYIEQLSAHGENDRAIAALRAIIEMAPFRSESWQLMGELLRKTGGMEPARRAFEHAAALDVHYRPKSGS